MPVVSNWTPAGDLMKFTDLTACGEVVAVYTVGWRILDEPDAWSNRFLNFKSGVDVAKAGRVLGHALREIVSDQGLSSGVAVTAALSSGAVQFEPAKPLAIAGSIAAKDAGLTWLPTLFTKQAHRRLHTLGSGSERDDEVKGKYTCPGVRNCKCLIIIDDLVTRGATFGEMARALGVATSGVPVVGLALGKNEKRNFAKDYGVIVDNSRLAQSWEKRWNGG
jgi:hypothetical protein